jgi:hypothetical protein
LSRTYPIHSWLSINPQASLKKDLKMIIPSASFANERSMKQRFLRENTQPKTNS